MLRFVRLRCQSFLGAFAKLRKATVSVVLSVSLSVRQSGRMEQLASHWKNVYEIWYLSIFRKSAEKIQVSLSSDKNNGNFTWRPINSLIISLSFLLIMRNVLDKSCRETQNTYLIFNNFFLKIAPFIR